MSAPTVARRPPLIEHGAEPVRGLPALLPAGERLIWQGGSDWKRLACEAFHVRGVMAWFVLLLVWQVTSAWIDGASASTIGETVLWYLVLGATATSVLALLAWAYARSTVYSITSHRVVIRAGVALPVTVTIPFDVIEAASVKRYRDGDGDVPLEISPGQHVSWLMLWPNVRPWCMFRPQPMLRAVPNVDAAVHALTQGLAQELELGQQLETADDYTTAGEALPA